jgi:pimeloyl-ACP methyl ester carboxylesterase
MSADDAIAVSLEEIQACDTPGESNTPLVLIHDGGGTTFQYWLLEDLNRQVFGIASPYFESGQKPPGGIKQLANDYASAIRTHLGPTKIILGGQDITILLLGAKAD